MANPRWRITIFNISRFIQNLVQGVFWVADYDSEVTFREFMIFSDILTNPKFLKLVTWIDGIDELFELNY